MLTVECLLSFCLPYLDNILFLSSAFTLSGPARLLFPTHFTTIDISSSVNGFSIATRFVFSLFSLIFLLLKSFMKKSEIIFTFPFITTRYVFIFVNDLVSSFLFLEGI